MNESIASYLIDKYVALLDAKDKIDEYLLDKSPEDKEYIELDNFVLDIMDIQCYIETAYNKLQDKYKVFNS